MTNIVEIGCDWLRFTTPDITVAAKMETIAETAWLDEFAQKGKRKNKSMLGYDGWGSEHLFFGSRNDGWFIQLTSSLAHSYMDDLLQLDANCTRIDLQFVVKHDYDNHSFGKTELLIAEEMRETGECESKAGLLLIDGRGKTGDTVQIGKRVSDKFGRLYDKWRESGEDVYENCWRYEVEYKGDVARFIAASLRRNSGTNAILGIVCTQYHNWGFSMNKYTYRDAELYSYKRSRYDSDKTVDWLAKQVNPSVQKLLSVGYTRDELMTILGLV